MKQSKTQNYLEELIRFKTISGLSHQAEVHRLYDWYEKQITNQHFTCRRFESNGFESLIIETEGKRTKPRVILLAHIDVVSAPEKLFKPKTKNGKILGRGASDMKCAAAVFLELLNTTPGIEKKNIKVVLVSDEEIGGFNGVKPLLEAGELDAEVVILPDGGDNFHVVKAAKGFIHLEVSAVGTSAHGSRPWEGKNAVLPLLQGYSKLESYCNKFDSDTWTNTVNLGAVLAGDFANVIPDEAMIKMDIRYTEKHSYEEMMHLIRKCFGEAVQYKVLVAGDPVKLDTKNQYVKKMLELVTKTTNQKVKYTKDHGGSDARYFTKYDIPVLLVKPNAGDHHMLTEWIEIESLNRYTEMIREYIVTL